MKIFHRLALFALVMGAVCSCSQLPVKHCATLAAGDVVYVVGQGWHAELGIPVAQLGPELDFYKQVFPGAGVIMFGYGKKTFVTSPPESFSERACIKKRYGYPELKT